jgi:hypothetical protein
MRGNPLLNITRDDVVENMFSGRSHSSGSMINCDSRCVLRGSRIMPICGYVVYRFRWSLRLHVYHISKRLKRQSVRGGYQEIDAEGYDLMVSYFPYDEGGTWVKDVLVPTIDRTERTRRRLEAHGPCEILSKEDEAEFDLFFEERDVTFNQVVIGAVIDAMQDSRKVMLVVTEGYLKDGKCCFEMEQAVHKSCCAQHGIDDVIVVLFDESLGVRLLSSLHQSLKLDKVLHWTPNDEDGKRLFWQQLKDRLRQDRQE